MSVDAPSTLREFRFASFVLQEYGDLFVLHYSVIFLVIALVAALFGFGGIAAGAVEIAKILFFIFAIIAIVTFVISLVKKS